MSLKCHSNGARITLTCDLCLRQTNVLTRVTGQWVNPRTRKKVKRRPAWVCPMCLERLRRDGGGK